ncbi:glycosyltransferase family 4 protein [Altererythrobacter sp. Root672]|uniref:glycosyltransferase family 4 protein n=1 Tax=Altererythrobacter sp. Root672 TaxID=1736584 RepID=UPI0006FF2E65|nr:glycosyltransferase family 4 protein [Altererythrobacter sp. Root672]KRA83790.1 hypothetical protein ASD76_07175 [Altererythrobacter sp. Root672]
MRVLTVSAFFESHGGGIEIVASALAQALARRGHDSLLAATALDPPPATSNVSSIALTARDPIEAVTGLPMPLLNRAARARLEDEVRRADALVIHDALYSTSLLARRYAERHKKPWLLIQHVGQIPYSSRVLRTVLRVANNLVTAPMITAAPQTVFISDVVRSQFTHLRCPRPPQLMFNGVDGTAFRAATENEKLALRQSLGVSAQRPQMLFVGRFVEKKGLSALRVLAALRPECDFLLVGNGPIDPSNWDLANVRVLGRKDRTELANIYRAADALVLPSMGEGYPLVVQEALACGLAVYCGADTAAADPAASSFLEGVEVDPRAPEITAQRFANAIAHPLSALPDQEASVFARERYDWDANAAKIERLLRALL